MVEGPKACVSTPTTWCDNEQLNTMEGGLWDRFKFWEDAWMGVEESLLARYPRLYGISSQQNQYIQHMGVFRDTGWDSVCSIMK